MRAKLSAVYQCKRGQTEMNHTLSKHRAGILAGSNGTLNRMRFLRDVEYQQESEKDLQQRMKAKQGGNTQPHSLAMSFGRLAATKTGGWAAPCAQEAAEVAIEDYLARKVTCLEGCLLTARKLRTLNHCPDELAGQTKAFRAGRGISGAGARPQPSRHHATDLWSGGPTKLPRAASAARGCDSERRGATLQATALAPFSA